MTKILKYLPHGINTKLFYSITSTNPKYNEFLEFKKNILGIEKDFVLLYNARNIRRKNPSDIIFAWKLFCDKIGKEKSDKCALLMHTSPVDEFGTDLNVVKELVGGNPNIILNGEIYGPDQMNFLYNLSDATILASSNEGWGLSMTESLVVGKMIIGTVTGGIQDQMRFENEKGEWIDFNSNFPSNHMGTYKKCGKWAIPMFPDALSIAGSIPTPYIFDDRVDFRSIAKAIEECFNIPKEERILRGEEGREWATGPEAKFTAEYMCESVINTIDHTFDTWEPRKHFELIKIDKEYPKKELKHKFIY